jgi:ABC-type multidrug transport system ATPase subunit
MGSDVLIKARNLVVTYNRWGQEVQGLKGIDIDIYQGQWVVLIGENGSGKSTLLKAIAGHIPPTRGSVELDAEVLGRQSTQFLSPVFYVAQNPLESTADGLTLIDNLAVADLCVTRASYWGFGRKKRYVDLLKAHGLASRANQVMRSFSGGERQFIALLIAKIRRPRILLLDEPFSALDSARISVAVEIVRALNAEGCTVVLVSHDLSITYSREARFVTLGGGRIADCTGGRPL